MYALTIEKAARGYVIKAGVSVLGKYRTEAAAVADLNDNREMLEYWAKSACVSIENTPAKIVRI